ncbi:MAG: SRPBCC domain-containing protein [Pseudolabrys sp.]|nr:SRPBCC domain-containing protein [Pseudolabrys sp.]
MEVFVLATTAIKPFVLTRTLNAPRQLVWDVWTKADHLKNWFGPAHVEVISAKVDLRPGGLFHYGMKTPAGIMWGKWIFREIVAPEKLVVVVSFSDENQGLTRHPLAPTWPMQTLSTTTFVEKDGKTEMTLVWQPYEATAEEIATFDAGRPGMTQGWAGTMGSLDAYLAKIQN